MLKPNSDVSVEPALERWGAAEHASIIGRLERLPRNSLQRRARLLIGTATFLDGFDVIAIAAVLPALIQKWTLSHAQVGFLISAGVVGQLFGALLFPILAGRLGRVKAIALSAALIGVMSLSTAASSSFNAFIAFRVLQGIGLGGEIPVAATYINEITRAEGRGRFVLMYELVYPIGLLAANGLGAWVVPRFGWEVMFWIGGLPLILAVAIPFLVPESPRWLAEKGFMRAADIAVSKFEAKVKGVLPAVTDTLDLASLLYRHPKRRIVELFGPVYLKRTVAVALLWMGSGVIQYGLATWLPTILVSIYHAPLQTALNLTVMSSVFMLGGSICCAFLIDVIGRKATIVSSYLLCAFTLLLAGIFRDQSAYVVAVLCSLSFAFMASGIMTAYVYTPELYPTSIRAIGCGVGFAWVKIAAIWASQMTSKLIGGGGVEVVFLSFAIFPLVAALYIHFFGDETKGRVLEELEI